MVFTAMTKPIDSLVKEKNIKSKIKQFPIYLSIKKKVLENLLME